ncbi:MAG: hypothetical protein HY657_00585 [Acidobacteria bacterium]|nr:hypothetical protein [Acidobacteriota bacterium]
MLSSVLVDVFVIPVARDRYELYCEVAPNPEAPAEPRPSGVFGGLRHRFALMLRAAEERQHRHDHAPAPGLAGRVQDRILAWIAQRIAEQRLLWNLRRETSAVAVHAQDMAFDRVLTIVRETLWRDYERHQRWMIVDGAAFLITAIVLGPFFLLVPGVANLPAAYFGFRAVGHWLSMRGAVQGLNRVTWSGRPCPPLAELRDLVALTPPARAARVHDIAARLRLQHLSTFFERVTVRHATL